MRCALRGRMSRTFSSFAVAGLVSLALFQDPHDKRSLADGLVGQPFASAIARLGPPDVGVGTAPLVWWRWNDSAGGRLSLAMHAGIVVLVDETAARGAVERRAVPPTGVYPGQPVAEVLARRGAPQRVAALPPPRRDQGPGGDQGVFADVVLVYPDQRLLVAAGFVLGPEPLRPVPTGPR